MKAACSQRTITVDETNQLVLLLDLEKPRERYSRRGLQEAQIMELLQAAALSVGVLQRPGHEPQEVKPHPAFLKQSQASGGSMTLSDKESR